MTPVPAKAIVPAGTRGETDDVRVILHSLSTEVLLLVTSEGKVIGTRRGVGSALQAPLGATALSRYVGAIVHPEDLVATLEFIEAARRHEVGLERLRVRALRPDGSWADHEVATVDPGLHPMLPGVVLRVGPVVGGGDDHGLDSAERFRSLAAALPIGVLSADHRGSVVSCNDRAEHILHRTTAELVGHGWERAIQAEDRAEVRGAADLAMCGGRGQPVRVRVDGSLSSQWASITFVPVGVAPTSTGWIATIEDLSERQRAESELAHLGTHDALTGLPARVLLEDRLRQSCARLRRGSQSVTVLVVGLDALEDVNEAHGRVIGDEVLVAVARRLRQEVRDVDTVSRYAGDEFAVLCEALDAEQAVELMGRLAAVVSEPIPLGAGEVRVAASIGVAATRDATAEAGDLLATADARMRRQRRAR